MRARTPRDTQTRCDCGFTSARTTPRMAAHALRLHSCDRWREITARNARGQAQRAAADTTSRDCQHLQMRHEHGTYTAYKLDGCRCTACRVANAAYASKVHRQTAYGRWQPYVDAEPARQHVRALMSAGMGWQRIARLAGVSTGGVSKLLYGAGDRGMEPSKRIRPANAQRLLAVTADQHADAALIPARPTWRRIEGLVALGYPKSWIAEQIGQHRALQLDRDFVYARTARTVQQLADRVGDTPGTSQRARQYASARGWLVPAYGTDEEIAEQRRMRADVNRELLQERREQVARLTANGLSGRQIANQLGIHQRQVVRDRGRMQEAS